MVVRAGTGVAFRVRYQTSGQKSSFFVIPDYEIVYRNDHTRLLWQHWFRRRLPAQEAFWVWRKDVATVDAHRSVPRICNPAFTLAVATANPHSLGHFISYQIAATERLAYIS